MNDQLPVRWDEELAKQAKEIAATERPMLTMISLRSGIMNVNGIAVPGNKMNCIVVASAFIREYYDKPFDADVRVNPVCFAMQENKNDGMVPHPAVKEPQSADCSTCEKSKWGSDIRDGKARKGQACKERRRLVLLPASAIAADGNPEKAEMAMMALPVTSVRNWANYVNTIAAQYQRPPWALITEISVRPHVKNQFEALFEVIGQVPDEHLGAVYKRIEMAKSVALAPYDYTGGQEQEPKKEEKKARKF